MTVAERLNYIPGVVDEYSTEVAAIERAGERLADRIEREQATLTRRDGTPVYGPQEHQERSAAILEVAGAESNAATQRYLTQAEREVADLEAKLARLEGEDGWERLSESERPTASLRREFLGEDAATLPPGELVKRARAAITVGDKPACLLYHPYISQRTALFGEEDRLARRHDLEAKLRAANALTVAVTTVRNASSGFTERAVTQFRQHVPTRW